MNATRKRLTPAQKFALKVYEIALSEEDRYLASVFVTEAGIRRMNAETKSAYDACKQLGMGPEHGLL